MECGESREQSMNVEGLPARHCPACSGDSRVSRSWTGADGSFFRRRICLKCGVVFETRERFERVMKKRKRKNPDLTGKC